MFGSFRLILAIGVVLAHMGVSTYSIHLGIVGVVCFYMVSGYAMSGLVAKSYPRLGDAPRFYLDRWLRLGPQYYFYIAICVFTVLILGWRETAAQVGSPDVVNSLAHLTIIPLSWWMFNSSIGTFLLDMPTWSLGLEATFYLVLPFLLTGRRLVWAAAVVGMVTWTLSTHGVINPDYYAYRLLPGTLVFFLVGVAVQRRDWWLYRTLVLFFMVSALWLWQADKVWLMFNAHLLVGAALGCVAVPLLARAPRHWLDDQIGTASYGCFLAHWIFVTALKTHYGETWAVSIAVVGSILCGWGTYHLIESPTVRLRHAMRRRHRPADGGALPHPAAAA